jgi:putative addiction module component (TIGR02574 family)
MTLEATHAATQTLSNADRLELALRLWEEITEGDWQPEPNQELAEELKRRIESHQADPENVRTGDQVWSRFGLQP